MAKNEIDARNVCQAVLTKEGHLKVGSFEQLYYELPPVAVPSFAAFSRIFGSQTRHLLQFKHKEPINWAIVNALDSFRQDVFTLNNIFAPLTTWAQESMLEHTKFSGTAHVGTEEFEKEEVFGMIYMTELFLRLSGHLPKDKKMTVMVCPTYKQFVPSIANIHWLFDSDDAASTPVHLYLAELAQVVTKSNGVTTYNDSNVYVGDGSLAITVIVDRSCHRVIFTCEETTPLPTS